MEKNNEKKIENDFDVFENDFGKQSVQNCT